MHLEVCKTATKVSKPILCHQTDDTKYDTHMVSMCNDYEVQPIYVRKQPKFPTRERNLAFRLSTNSTKFCINLGNELTVVEHGMDSSLAITY
uniref:Uncharacterized protein n=1 Tax=Glossina austeni TaxID=7395 RepID=A0A1A9V3V8_GLOAU